MSEKKNNKKTETVANNTVTVNIIDWVKKNYIVVIAAVAILIVIITIVASLGGKSEDKTVVEALINEVNKVIYGYGSCGSIKQDHDSAVSLNAHFNGFPGLPPSHGCYG